MMVGKWGCILYTSDVQSVMKVIVMDNNNQMVVG